MNLTESLLYWYSNNKRNLPWRETQNPYQIWLSEIILQQTQIKQGLPYYESFVKHFPTVFDLAKAEEDTVLKHWQGLGYYSRARNLHYTAKYVVDNFNGKFPNSYKDLINLKGIGDYTASAISSICFDEKCAVVDGNVYRFLSRYFGVETPINTSKGIKEFKLLAQSLLPNKNIGEYNQAIMEFGSRQCSPGLPECSKCPLNNSCFALQHKTVNSLPVKIKKTNIKKRFFNYVVLVTKDQRTLLIKRKGKGIWQNLYQFPLIESPDTWSMRQIVKSSKFNSIIQQSSFEINLFNELEIVHKLSHQHLYTRFWIVTVNQLLEKGISVSEIEKFPVPTLISNFIDSFNFSHQ